jgi:GTPase-associated system helical domain
MPRFNFADSYREAALNAGPEVLRLRQEPFEKMRQRMDVATALDLTRLYFGLPVPNGTDWFRDAFGETDPSFSMYDNGREAAVLAAGLLGAALEDDKPYAALAPLTTSAAGHREPVVNAELLEDARRMLGESAVATREWKMADPLQIKLAAQSNVPGEAATLPQANDWGKVATLFKLVSEEWTGATKDLATQVTNVMVPLSGQVAALREEVEMLWWYVGGWSRVLNKPFHELKPGLAAAMAGLDMADLSRTPFGPIAAPAILQRIVSGVRRRQPSKVTIKDAVEALPSRAFDGLQLAAELKNVLDLCPVLAAFLKASEIGRGSAWHGPFASATRLDATAEFQPLELATQVYRERLLLSVLR